jgi:hypothetical protein
MLCRADSVVTLISWYGTITYKHSYLCKILFILIFNFSNTIFIEQVRVFKKLHSVFFTKVVPMLLLIITKTFFYKIGIVRPAKKVYFGSVAL